MRTSVPAWVTPAIGFLEHFSGIDMLGFMRHNVTVLVKALGVIAMLAFIPSIAAAQVAVPDSGATLQNGNPPSVGAAANPDQVAAES